MTRGANHAMLPRMSEPPRRGGMNTLAAALPKAATPAMRRRGFAQAAILSRWSEIVGPELAAQSAPERLIFPRVTDEARAANAGAGGGTLHVRASGVLALELQHLAPLVIERINGFFGYPAVVRLSLHQAPMPPRAKTLKRPPPRALSATETEAIETAVARLDDEALRDRLRALGRHVAAAQKPQVAAGQKGPPDKGG